MDFIQTANKQVDKFGAGKHGFSPGNPTGGIPATYLSPDWYDNVQQELVNVIEGAGIAINPASKTQLQQAIQAMIAGTTGNDFKASVRFTTTGNIALSGLGTQAGGDWAAPLTAGDRIMPKDQTTGSQNGFYIAAAGAWTRATDADGAGELTSGSVVAVEEGTLYADSQWMLTTDGPITIGTTSLTFTRKDTVIAATGFRNKIINGGMAIDQRNAGAVQAFTAGAALAYCVDRFYGYCTGANVNGQRVAGSGVSQYRYQFAGAASVTGIGLGQRIEKINSMDLAGSTATLSVDLANSLLTTVNWTAYYANTDDTFGTLASPTRTQIATGSFTVNGSVARYSTQIAIPAGATTGVEVVFSVGAQTSGTWTIGNLQLEAGSSATAFERRPIWGELAACQRYFEKLLTTVQSSFASGGTGFAAWVFKATKRATPTISLGAGSSTISVNDVDRLETNAAGYAYINVPTSATAEL